MGDNILDNNQGFVLTEDEFGNVCSNLTGITTFEFYRSNEEG